MPRPARRLDPIAVSSTDAQNRFGHYLDEAAKHRPIIITKRDEPRAVLLSFERYQSLVGEETPGLEKLRERFDALFDQMQTPEAQTALADSYASTGEEMGAAAVEAVRRRTPAPR
jgi:prevent-host-death family protein